MEAICLSIRRNENLEDKGRGKMTVGEAGRRVGARGGPVECVKSLRKEKSMKKNECVTVLSTHTRLSVFFFSLK
jgi:hypothetical protein